MTTKSRAGVHVKARTLAARSLPRKRADQVKGGFFKSCVAGAHYKTVTLEMRKSGGDPK